MKTSAVTSNTQIRGLILDNRRNKMTVLKPVAVIDSETGGHQVHFFNTIKEAQENQKVLDMKAPYIYSVYMRGKPIQSIDWKLETDTAANLKENKKAAMAAVPRSGKYSETELATLKQACKDGKSYKEIAKALFRSENSVYQKAIAAGFTTKTPRIKKKKTLKDRKNQIKENTSALGAFGGRTH
jgi:hypothetical protein